MFRRKPEELARGSAASAARPCTATVDIDLSALAATAPMPEPKIGWRESSQGPLHSLSAELIDALLRRRI